MFARRGAAAGAGAAAAAAPVIGGSHSNRAIVAVTVT
jgi:hypothetical protein